MKNIYFMILMFLLPIHLHAAPVGSGKIAGLTTYTTFGDGDVVFKLSTPVVGCDDGYWLNKKVNLRQPCVT